MKKDTTCSWDAQELITKERIKMRATVLLDEASADLESDGIESEGSG